jgi:hypothetical protein
VKWPGAIHEGNGVAAILIEKTAARGPWLARATGLVLFGWALYLLRSGLPG